MNDDDDPNQKPRLSEQSLGYFLYFLLKHKLTLPNDSTFEQGELYLIQLPLFSSADKETPAGSREATDEPVHGLEPAGAQEDLRGDSGHAQRRDL